MSIEVKVKDTAFGKLVPDHLLNFTGSASLQSYYRDLLKTNYGKGFDKIDLGQCATCHASQTVTDSPRLKSLPKMTSRIHRSLVRQACGKQLGKFDQHILKKFLESKQKLIVKCSICHSINKMPLMSKKDLILLRTQQLNSVKSMEYQEKDVKSAKNKKKKKQKPEEAFLPNSLLPLPNDDVGSWISQQSNLEEEATTSHSSIPLPSKKSASLQDLVKPLNEENQSKSFLLQKSLGIKLPPSKKTENTTTFKQTVKKKSVSKQKQLKAFLKDNLSSEKSTSLSDFLSSL